jgi:hypothetical protein
MMSLTYRAMTLTLAPLNVLHCITLFNVWRGTEFASYGTVIAIQNATKNKTDDSKSRIAHFPVPPEALMT